MAWEDGASAAAGDAVHEAARAEVHTEVEEEMHKEEDDEEEEEVRAGDPQRVRPLSCSTVTILFNRLIRCVWSFRGRSLGKDLHFPFKPPNDGPENSKHIVGDAPV